jgi:hypothetical protein
MREIPLTLLAVVALTACSEMSPLPSSPDAAGYTLPTDSVGVDCSGNLADGQMGACLAQGYDASGFFTTNVSSWTNLTPELISMEPSGFGITVKAHHMVSGTARVRATIEGVSGESDIDIYISTLAASIEGEGEVPPGDLCSWAASVSGGSTPYSYYWTRSGSMAFSTQPFYEVQAISNFTIYLLVTDNRGTERLAVFPVTVDANAPTCPTR